MGVTKHVVEDDLLREMAVWAEEQAKSLVDEDPTMDVTRAGLPAFIEACRSTAQRGEKPTPAMPSVGDANNPTMNMPLAIEEGNNEGNMIGEASCDNGDIIITPTQTLPTQTLPTQNLNQQQGAVSHVISSHMGKRQRVE